MHAKSVYLRRSHYYSGEAAKTKIKREKKSRSFSKLVFVFVFAVIIAIFSYIFSINSAAIKGYNFRKAENELNNLIKTNEELKIREAELRSLRNVEEASKKLNMAEIKTISYIQQTSPFALNKPGIFNHQ